MEDFLFRTFGMLMMYVIGPLIMIALVAFIIALPFLGYYAWVDYHSPTFSLTKADWRCTDTQTFSTVVVVDRIGVPVVNTECVQWTRN